MHLAHIGCETPQATAAAAEVADAVGAEVGVPGVFHSDTLVPTEAQVQCTERVVACRNVHPKLLVSSTRVSEEATQAALVAG